MVFKICDRCKYTRVQTLVPKLKKMFPMAEIKIGCQNLCGIGRNKTFVIVDYIPIIASDEEQLLQKVQEYVDRQNER